MAGAIDWQSRIGRRLRLRDLHILYVVAECGSMARAGAQLRVTHPAISKAIGDLEAAVGVRLLDRSPRGVEPTVYGEALLKCGLAAFDELRSGISNIEHLANPEVGDVQVGFTEAVAAGFLPSVIERFSSRHPKVKLNHVQTSIDVEGYTALRERRADVIITLSLDGKLTDDVQSEILFHERICLVAAAQSAWAKRRDLDLADVADAVFIAPPPDSPGGRALVDAFRTAGLPPPRVCLTTFSVHVRNILPSVAGRFIAVLPASILRFDPGVYPLKELPLDLPLPAWPVICVTLKKRTLRPAVERFIACAREVAGAMQAPAPSAKSGARRRGGR